MNNELPQRFRESSFRDYERTIAAAMSTSPIAFKVDPRLLGKAQVTFACRLRDAMKSYKDNNWPSILDHEKFLIMYESKRLMVSERTDGSILIGSQSAIDQFATSSNGVKTPAIPEAKNSEILIVQTIDEKKLLMILSSRRLLAPRLRVFGLNDPEVEQFQLDYDVALEKTPDGYILI
jgi:hypothetical protein